METSSTGERLVYSSHAAAQRSPERKTGVVIVYLAVLCTLMHGVAMRGAKMLASLDALALGASPMQVGILAALFPLFPLMLAVYAGRVSDRIGVKKPMVAGAAVNAAALVIPLAWPGLWGLFACATLFGLGHIFLHVSAHNLIGSYGGGEARVRNFATFSLGGSLSAFIGPSMTGFSIDHLGFNTTLAALAVVALMPALILLAIPRIVPPGTAPQERTQRNAFELLAIPPLRRTLLMSGVTLTGVELFTFYFPVYGRSIGLTASAIGLVMSSYAIAAFIVRMAMGRATRSVGEIGVLTASLLMAGATFMLVPLVSHALLLAGIAFLLGIGLGCAQPLTILLTYNHAPAGRSGEALGMRLTVNKFTQIFVPLVFGAMGSAFGLIPVFWANGIFLFAGGALSLAERRNPIKGGAAAIAGPQEEEK
jgi:MFS family permease